MSSEREPFRLRRAVSADIGEIEQLLHASHLPLAGLADAELIVAREQPSGQLAAVGGLEVRSRHGLLRSLAVSGDYRGHRLGTRLVAEIEALGREFGLSDVYLLTTTAGPLFAKLGYIDVDRKHAPPALASSAEWNSAVCPASARLMHKLLGV